MCYIKLKVKRLIVSIPLLYLTAMRDETFQMFGF